MKGMSTWRLGHVKRALWIADLRQFLRDDVLTPGQASKLAGKLAFLNSYLFNRLGRAMLRPIIWRQTQQRGSFHLTPRLRNSLLWFLSVLERGLTREIALSRQFDAPVVILYSDVEDNGRIGDVSVPQFGRVEFFPRGNSSKSSADVNA